MARIGRAISNRPVAMIILLAWSRRRVVKCIVDVIRLRTCVSRGYVIVVRAELGVGCSQNIFVADIMAMIEQAGGGKKPG